MMIGLGKQKLNAGSQNNVQKGEIGALSGFPRASGRVQNRRGRSGW
jgi:hypothetical protein